MTEESNKKTPAWHYVKHIRPSDVLVLGGYALSFIYVWRGEYSRATFVAVMAMTVLVARVYVAVSYMMVALQLQLMEKQNMMTMAAMLDKTLAEHEVTDHDTPGMYL